MGFSVFVLYIVVISLEDQLGTSSNATSDDCVAENIVVTNLRATAYLTLPGIHKGGNCRYNGRILNPQWARSKPDTENNYHCKADIYIEWDIKDGVSTCNNDTYYKLLISKVRGSNVNLDCNEENRMSGRRDNNVKTLMEDDSPDLDLESGDGSGDFKVSNEVEVLCGDISRVYLFNYQPKSGSHCDASLEPFSVSLPLNETHYQFTSRNNSIIWTSCQYEVYLYLVNETSESLLYKRNVSTRRDDLWNPLLTPEDTGSAISWINGGYYPIINATVKGLYPYMGISWRSSRLEEMGCPFCNFAPDCSELVLVVMLKLDSSSTTTVEFVTKRGGKLDPEPPKKLSYKYEILVEAVHKDVNLDIINLHFIYQLNYFALTANSICLHLRSNDFYPDPVVNLTILDSSIETLIFNNTANDTITVVSLNISWSPGNLNGKLKNYEIIIFSNNVVNGLEALVYQNTTHKDSQVLANFEVQNITNSTILLNLTVGVRADNSFHKGEWTYTNISLPLPAVKDDNETVDPEGGDNNRVSLIAGISVSAFILFVILIVCLLIVGIICHKLRSGMQCDHRARKLRESCILLENLNGAIVWPIDEDVLVEFEQDTPLIQHYGAFGTVRKGYIRDNESGTDHECVELQFMTSIASLHVQDEAAVHTSLSFQLREEISKMKILNESDHFLSIMCITYLPRASYSFRICLENVNGENFQHYLQDVQNAKRLTIEKIYCLAMQIVDGLTFLRDKDIVHGHLLARNIMIVSHRDLKITYFGIHWNVIEFSRSLSKPVQWMSPETLMEGTSTSESDIWSFGIVLWEICSLGQQPYAYLGDGIEVQLLEKLMLGERLIKPEKSDDFLYSVMKECWQETPAERPSTGQLFDQLSAIMQPQHLEHR